MRNRTATDAEILAQITGARERGRRARAVEPRAKSARYSRVTGRLTVTLTNNAIFGFPARLAPGLDNASEAQLAKVEVSPSGEGLLWPDIDADLSVAGMLRAMLGGKAVMRELGRSGGLARSQAKAAAARSNGARGGRPRASKRQNRR